MLESLTIFSKGGLILYQYTASPSLVADVDNAVQHTHDALNNVLIAQMLRQGSSKTYHMEQGLTYMWMIQQDLIVAALYPDILFEGPRQYLKNWCQQLLTKTCQEYLLYQQSAAAANNSIRPDPQPFDQTFRVLLQQSKGQGVEPPSSSTAATSKTTATTTKTTAKKTGKEKRTWHDGNAKVTEKAMAELDHSKAQEQDADAQKQERMERALQEARQAYLPDASELQQQEQEIQQQQQQQDTTNTWSSSVTSLLQQMTGNKVLSATDLDAPLQAMEELLISKNVASDIAHSLVESCRAKLTGKRLNSLARVQTAVQQAMTSVLERWLDQNRVDLLRNVLSKRGDGLLQSLTKSKQQRPYVISVMGINGIGKTTTLAKLAWYFQQHDCSPLLVAGDTFRSGAVEQLKVHADCLNVPLFSQGYSQDPSAVAKAAIQQATVQNNDVVLIDTAGRMQNNVPLMKALGKLVSENQPDFILLVCEALVGHDGLDQFAMFQKACGRCKIDGLVLTKMDIVADKVGAALTLTQNTGTPIVFCGTGQKYHHLQPLSVSAVIQSLLS